MRTRTLRLLVPLGFAVAVGCGPNVGGSDGDGTGDKDGDGTGTQCLKGATTLTGRVMGPNGLDPIVGAQVYHATDPQDYVPGVGCDMCEVNIDRGIDAIAVSGSDGAFSLELPAVGSGSIPITVKKGRFRRTVDVQVTACEPNALPADSTRLPRTSAEGDLPKIGVVTGIFDKMQNVLDGMGIAQYDLIDGSDDGTGAPWIQVAQDLSKLKEYNLIVINCGEQHEEELAALAAVRSNLKAYVEAGGRLYVTDWAYDWVEQVFPEAIDFAPAEEADQSAAEPIDDGQVLGNEEYNAQLTDEDLSAWLGNFTPSAATGAPVQITDSWVAPLKAMENTKTWVQGPVDYNGQRTIPLTMTFERGCGRVLYSNYHTVGFESGGTLTDQERILEYLIYEVGTCISIE